MGAKHLGCYMIDSRFLTVSPYSSQVRSTGSEGSSPFFEEKPWTVRSQDLNMNQDAQGACAPGY
jgi:hypothetical protein